jgi:hypothetical protein
MQTAIWLYGSLLQTLASGFSIASEFAGIGLAGWLTMEFIIAHCLFITDNGLLAIRASLTIKPAGC